MFHLVGKISKKHRNTRTRLCRNSAAAGFYRKRRLRQRIGGAAFCRKEANQGTYSFSVSCEFSARVFCSTPFIFREFARGLSFGRKYAKNNSFAQSTEHQLLTLKTDSSVMQKALFQGVIQPISEAETHNITP